MKQTITITLSLNDAIMLEGILSEQLNSTPVIRLQRTIEEALKKRKQSNADNPKPRPFG